MRKFQCRKCGETIETTTEAYCAPSLLQRERTPTCPNCGLDMLEIID
jgi:DNA-directed RNA polymerase subunit RPC12/RpoP